MQIYEILKNDHENLINLFNELITLEQNDDFANVLIEQIKNELIPHSRAEESVFYNSIRAVASDNSDIMHSYKEHLEAETLLRTMQVKDKVSANWKETAIKLKAALEHHIDEEEGKVFTEAKTLFSPEEASMMGEAFLALKEKVVQQGFVKSSFDMVVNLMPPRFVDQIRSLSSI